MKSLLLPLATALISLTDSAMAGGAVFSKDGGTLYISPMFEKGVLFKVDVASRKASKVDLSGVIGKDADLGTVARTPEGDVVLEAGGTLWKWKPGSGKATKLPPLPTDFILTEIGCLEESTDAALKGAILLTGSMKESFENKFYALAPGREAFQEVFVRRINRVTAQPAFSAKGRMFFGGDFDLWEGSLGDIEDTRAGTLSGCRIAPLAVANTDMANGGSMGVMEVAVAGEKIYVLLRGRHMGAVVSVPMPKVVRYQNGSEAGHPDTPEAYQLMTDSLAKVQIVLPDGECDALAAAAPGGVPTVFFRVRGEGGVDWLLSTQHGKPEKIGAEKRP